MNAADGSRKRHLAVDNFHRSAPYKSPRTFRVPPVPVRPNPGAHGKTLIGQVTQIQKDYAALAQSWEGREDIRARGLIIELESAPDVGIAIERFQDQGLELLNERDVRDAQGRMITRQTWFVPDGKLALIAGVLNDYLTKTRKQKGKAQPLYRGLIESIERITRAVAEQLWTERGEPFPAQETLWFEVWLRAGATPGERKEILAQFRRLGTQAGLKVGEGRIDLPEHTVVSARGKGSAFSTDLAVLNCIAEIRRGRDYADFYTGLTVPEQAQLVDDLRQRTRPIPSNAPFISVLDTGINRGHPLLEPLIPESDNLTINPAWSAADDDDHGTGMAGLCLYGDLSPVLSGSGAVEVPAQVEGVKVVPPPAQRGNDEKLAGYYTAQGVALAEANAPGRLRVWCLASTMKCPNDPRPSSWSSELDALACGRDNDGAVRRLFCLSSGNVEQAEWPDYPESNFDHGVENPGQAWNALCIGSFTDFALIRAANANYSPVALRGAMAPTNSTSRTWDNVWPNKPDVVFEGGNAGREATTHSTLQLPELMLLATSADFRRGALTATCGTSPATALAARMAAQVVADYPHLWPETVRGLIVHSASWTPQMEKGCPGNISDKEKGKFLLRTVGYGVPNLRTALECASSRVTMLAQSDLSPFRLEKDKIIYNEMHLHSLPWPKGILTAHPFERVRLRVTLSYFVEPNPGNRGYTTTFRYPGCQLRFRVSSPGQPEAHLEAQVSKLAAEEMRRANSEQYVSGSTKGWIIGQQAQRGSLHCDTWEGTAADLLSMQHVAIYPMTGWWRTRPSQGRATTRIKYALIVSIEAQNPALDIYTEIANQIAVPIAVPTS
jgi:hypothetical protein